jgi:pimeloyl-ACP methyl ester carboxylesterase
VTVETISANGLRFAYLAEGAGPLVVLLHGFPDTPHTWDAVRPALAQAGFRAVSPFMRGYAPTEIPRDGRYDREALAADVLGLIEAFGRESKEENAIVVGHDWGAEAAYAAARVGPERVRLLVTVAIPYPASVIPTPGLLWRARHLISLRFRGAAAQVRKNDFALVDELMRRWSPTWDPSPAESAAVKEVFRDPASLDAALGYYRQAQLAVRKPIEVPTVSFAGQHDIIAVAAYERARRWFKNEYQVIAVPGGHFMHREHPARFIDELGRVLGRWR